MGTGASIPETPRPLAHRWFCSHDPARRNAACVTRLGRGRENPPTRRSFYGSQRRLCDRSDGSRHGQRVFDVRARRDPLAHSIGRTGNHHDFDGPFSVFRPAPRRSRRTTSSRAASARSRRENSGSCWLRCSSGPLRSRPGRGDPLAHRTAALATGEAVRNASFHAVSAFCNAGFSMRSSS